MNLSEILSLTDKDLLNLSITQLTKKLGVGGAIITDEMKKHGFKYNKGSGTIFLDGELVKNIKNGSNTERLKQLYVFIAEVRCVLFMMSDAKTKRFCEMNVEEEFEVMTGFDCDTFVLDAGIKTAQQIQNQIQKYFVENCK